MLKQFTFYGFAIYALVLPFFAQAEIYKQVDADGHVTYSNVKIKGAKKLVLEPADTNFGTESIAPRRASSKSATPASFPKVNSETQKQRDGSRKEILQSELDTEKKALEDAKKAFAEGESNPEVFQKKNADGSSRTFRNVPKFQEKMKNLQADVDAHQRNIELLEKEISSIN
jgi:dipeptidase